MISQQENKKKMATKSSQDKELVTHLKYKFNLPVLTENEFKNYLII